MLLPNAAPRFNLIRVLSIEGFDVKLSASAHDTDGDPITYTIDWGDGSAPTRTEGIVSAHRYPVGQYAAYDITIVADDGRGGDDDDTDDAYEVFNMLLLMDDGRRFVRWLSQWQECSQDDDGNDCDGK